MTRVVVNVLDVNRVRHVNLDGITEALADALEAARRTPAWDRAGEPHLLDAPHELLRALRALRTQPLPEHLMDERMGPAVELEAPRDELEQLADELERIRAGIPSSAATASLRSTLGELERRVRVRVAQR